MVQSCGENGEELATIDRGRLKQPLARLGVGIPARRVANAWSWTPKVLRLLRVTVRLRLLHVNVPKVGEALAEEHFAKS